jgi:hypothetical protein
MVPCCWQSNNRVMSVDIYLTVRQQCDACRFAKGYAWNGQDSILSMKAGMYLFTITSTVEQAGMFFFVT